MDAEFALKQSLVDLLNRGEKVQAYRIACLHRHDGFNKASTGYQMALACLLYDDLATATEIFEETIRAEGFTDHMRADWYRDMALYYIRLTQRQPDEYKSDRAMTYLMQMDTLRAHELKDLNKLAADELAWGRYYLSLQQLDSAEAKFRSAYRRLEGYWPRDEQYFLNITFWQAFISTLQSRDRSRYWRMKVIRSDRSKKRVLLMRVLNRTPRSAHRRILLAALRQM